MCANFSSRSHSHDTCMLSSIQRNEAIYLIKLNEAFLLRQETFYARLLLGFMTQSCEEREYKFPWRVLTTYPQNDKRYSRDKKNCSPKAWKQVDVGDYHACKQSINGSDGTDVTWVDLRSHVEIDGLQLRSINHLTGDAENRYRKVVTSLSDQSRQFYW